MKKLRILSLLWLYVLWGPATAQIDTTFNKKVIPFESYLALVGQNNLSYAAEKFNLDIAQAGIESAKVFPNPQLYFGYFNTNQSRLALGYGYIVNVSQTIELGGKRKARTDLASDNAELTKALLENYFRNLRADATIAYLFALKSKSILQVKLNSYSSVRSIASVDSIRFSLSTLSENDARQSNVEAGSFLNALLQSEAEWKIALANLGLLLGKVNSDTLYYPIGKFDAFEREFIFDSLLVAAQINRADLLAALRNTNVAQRMLNLVKANRVIDLGIILGSNNTSVSTSYFAPTPSFTQISGGISIPLKFSNNYKGDIMTARYQIAQANLQYRQAQLQVQTEVTQAYTNYIAVRRQIRQFRSGLLEESRRVLEGRLYSYRRGSSSLLELLVAQRTYNDLQLNYFETLYNYAAALIELERAVGIWDINF